MVCAGDLIDSVHQCASMYINGSMLDVIVNKYAYICIYAVQGLYAV